MRPLITQSSMCWEMIFQEREVKNLDHKVLNVYATAGSPVPGSGISSGGPPCTQEARADWSGHRGMQ